MNVRREGFWLGLVTLVWSAAWCADLADAWRHAPYDRLGWLAAAGWMAAVAAGGGDGRAVSRGWLALSWLATLGGVAGELNVAQHVGLGLAGAAWVGGGGRGGLVLALAASWWPAAGWLGRGAGVEAVLAARVVGALLGVGLAWVWWTRGGGKK